MITLRPYQQEALDEVLSAMRHQQRVLLQAATGAGKTILFSSLIQHCMNEHQMRIAVVAHREILVRQAYDKLLKVWPEGRDKVGIACSSVSADVNIAAPVVIGSPQTLCNRLGECEPFHLVIIDECHRVAPQNIKSLYKNMLLTLQSYYPKLRLLGVTATPYRLSQGYIYGSECKKGTQNWWKNLACSISIRTLQEQGFLAPFHAKEAVDMADELKNVKTSSGEFDTQQLGELMGRQVHISNAVTAYEQCAGDRRHVVVFAVTIEHAKLLQHAFEEAGYPAGVVHSKMPKADRNATLAAFENGSLRVVCNVGVLTEGWDCTGVDCMLMCRPTLSPALFVQMVGRGLRIHEGKTDCLILDLSGNFQRHGADPDNPVVTWSRGTGRKKPKDPAAKKCPNCREMLPPGTRECPECGFIFDVGLSENTAPIVMQDVAVPEPRPDLEIVAVDGVNIAPYVSKAGNRMARLSLQCKLGNQLAPLFVSHFLDFDGEASERGRFRARLWWAKVSGNLGTKPPESVDEAISRFNEVRIPDILPLKKNGQYYNVVGW